MGKNMTKQLFQKIDPYQDNDPDIAKIGRIGKAIYNEGLFWIRRNFTDGHIPARAWGEISDGYPDALSHRDALVRVGLWKKKSDGWDVRNWAVWNLTASQRAARSEERKASGRRGSLKRWHAEGRHSISAPVSDCPDCQAEGWLATDVASHCDKPPTPS